MEKTFIVRTIHPCVSSYSKPIIKRHCHSRRLAIKIRILRNSEYLRNFTNIEMKNRSLDTVLLFRLFKFHLQN